MKIAIGTDHGGYPLKADIIQALQQAGHELIDVGAYSLNPTDDYPDFALAVSKAVQSKLAERGIVICGSGVGACVAANKLKGIRAGMCHDTYSAHQGVEHDDMNVLCLGSRVIGSAPALEIARVFVKATFSGAERHKRRLGKILEIERKQE